MIRRLLSISLPISRASVSTGLLVKSGVLLTGYVPLFFEKYFPVVTEDRPVFRDTELRIRTVRGQALCAECQSLYNVMKQEGRCPKCGSREKKILGGQQFLVKEIGY